MSELVYVNFVKYICSICKKVITHTKTKTRGLGITVQFYETVFKRRLTIGNPYPANYADISIIWLIVFDETI